MERGKLSSTLLKNFDLCNLLPLPRHVLTFLKYCIECFCVLPLCRKFMPQSSHTCKYWWRWRSCAESSSALLGQEAREVSLMHHTLRLTRPDAITLLTGLSKDLQKLNWPIILVMVGRGRGCLFVMVKLSLRLSVTRGWIDYYCCCCS